MLELCGLQYFVTLAFSCMQDMQGFFYRSVPHLLCDSCVWWRGFLEHLLCTG